MNDYHKFEDSELFLLYFQRVKPVSSMLRLENDLSDWQGKLHHLASGEIVELKSMDDLMKVLRHYMSEHVDAEKTSSGLK